MNRRSRQKGVWTAVVSSLVVTYAEAQPASSGGTSDPNVTPTGGLTADEVGRRAAETSYSAAAAREALLAAQARVDQAWTLYVPRLATVARYMRASDFLPPPIVPGPGTLVGTGAPVGTPNPPTVSLPVLH